MDSLVFPFLLRLAYPDSLRLIFSFISLDILIFKSILKVPPIDHHTLWVYIWNTQSVEKRI